MRIRLVVVLALAVLGGLLAPSARGAELWHEYKTDISPERADYHSWFELYLYASPGETNRVTVARESSSVAISDLTAPIEWIPHDVGGSGGSWRCDVTGETTTPGSALCAYTWDGPDFSCLDNSCHQNFQTDGGWRVVHIFLGYGDDQARTVNGSRDTVHCGPNTDTVVADQYDVVSPDCENVTQP